MIESNPSKLIMLKLKWDQDIRYLPMFREMVLAEVHAVVKIRRGEGPFHYKKGPLSHFQ